MVCWRWRVIAGNTNPASQGRRDPVCSGIRLCTYAKWRSIPALDTLYELGSHLGTVNVQGILLDGKGLNSKILGVPTWALPVALKLNKRSSESVQTSRFSSNCRAASGSNYSGTATSTSSSSHEHKNLFLSSKLHRQVKQLWLRKQHNLNLLHQPNRYPHNEQDPLHKPRSQHMLDHQHNQQFRCVRHLRRQRRLHARLQHLHNQLRLDRVNPRLNKDSHSLVNPDLSRLHNASPTWTLYKTYMHHQDPTGSTCETSAWSGVCNSTSNSRESALDALKNMFDNINRLAQKGSNGKYPNAEIRVVCDTQNVLLQFLNFSL